MMSRYFLDVCRYMLVGSTTTSRFFLTRLSIQCGVFSFTALLSIFTFPGILFTFMQECGLYVHVCKFVSFIPTVMSSGVWKIKTCHQVFGWSPV
jgi:hypothetical protein